MGIDMNKICCGILLFISFVLLGASPVAAQDANANKAKAYYFQAEKAFGKGSYESALSSLSQTEKLLGSSNSRTTALKVKIYYAQGEYQRAKTTLDRFYGLKSSDSLAQEMSDYIVKVDEKINAQRLAKIKARQDAIAAKEKARKDAIAAKEKARLAAIQAEKDKQAKILSDDRAEHRNFETWCTRDSNDYYCYATALRYAFGKPTTAVDYPLAAKYYSKSCYPRRWRVAGYFSGCSNLGYLYESGDIPPDLRFEGVLFDEKLKDVKSSNGLREAFVLYKMACDSPNSSDHSYGCRNLANFYKDGVSDGKETIVSKSTLLARQAYDKACKAGRDLACEESKKLQADNLEWLDKKVSSCDSGNGKDCQFAGFAYFYGTLISRVVETADKYSVRSRVLRSGGRETIPKDLDKAEKYLEKACEANIYSGCHKLSVLLQDRYDSTKHTETMISAYDAYRKACADGRFSAMCDLRELENDVERYFAELENKCQEGVGLRCEILGDAYDNGKGVDIDDTRAAGYFLKGCNLGRARSCNVYGVLLRSGEGLTRNDHKAVEYYEKACDMGYAKGCLNNGEIYLSDNVAVKNNPKLAERYFQRGCLERNRDSCQGLVDYLYEEIPVNKLKKHLVSLRVVKYACDELYYGGSYDGNACTYWQKILAPKLQKKAAKKRLPTFN